MVVRTGLETLLDEHIKLVENRRLGLIANQSSVNSQLQYGLDLLLAHPGITLTTVMGPQHGIWGETQDNMIEWEGSKDARTQLPFFSLYGKTRTPSPEMLSEVDALVFDLQDVGARYYTFISTMALAMRACREHGKQFIVLDRPNPINGTDTEGPVLDARFSSFVGIYPLAVRHGMTVGELAMYFNSEFKIGCDLEVVRMAGWEREMFFDQTGLPWVAPSPNMPSVETAMVYPGMCLLEGTNVSEGRGTTLPFEISGAPWIDPFELVRRLESLDLPGAIFRPLYFMPTFHKWQGEQTGGLQIHVRERRQFLPFATGVALLQLYRQMGEARFAWKNPPYEYEEAKLPIDILAGTDQLREMIESGASLEDLKESWREEHRTFRQTREKYLLY